MRAWFLVPLAALAGCCLSWLGMALGLTPVGAAAVGGVVSFTVALAVPLRRSPRGRPPVDR